MFTVHLLSVAADLMVHDDTRPPTLSSETQTKELDRQIDREVKAKTKTSGDMVRASLNEAHLGWM